MTEQHDAFWARFLGVSPRVWNLPGTSVSAHVGLSGYSGVWFFRRRERLVVSAPTGWVHHLNQVRWNSADYDEWTQAPRLLELFGEAFARRIGPAFQGALAPRDFVPLKSNRVRQVTDEDQRSIAAFYAECGEDDLDDSGLREATSYQTACFEAGYILAMAGFRTWDIASGDPCVLTRPSHRGRGYGTAVVSRTVELALGAGKVLLYQTLESNIAAVQLAQRLGYDRYARHVAVRLNAGEPRSTPEP